MRKPRAPSPSARIAAALERIAARLEAGMETPTIIWQPGDPRRRPSNHFRDIDPNALPTHPIGADQNGDQAR